MSSGPRTERIETEPATTALIERARLVDAAEIAELYLASRHDALPYLRRIHSDAETREWIAGTLLETRETWVARFGGQVIGVLALQGEELDQLYLLPGWYRRGVGSRLLAKARELSPKRLVLFTVQRNLRARAFYEAHGFRVVDMNDGSRNEEGEPDILYEWRPEEG